jgi:hypothetical protein
LASSHSKVKLIAQNIRCFGKAGKASNAGHQRRARTAASDKSCMRDILIARPLHTIVMSAYERRDSIAHLLVWQHLQRA